MEKNYLDHIIDNVLNLSDKRQAEKIKVACGEKTVNKAVLLQEALKNRLQRS